MAEAIQSRDAFYINSTYDRPAEVIVTDDTSLLERTEGYCIHVTRWALDTQSSMFSLKKTKTRKSASKSSIKTVGNGDSTALTASRSLRIYRL